MATTGTTGTVPTTAQQNVVPNTGQQLAAPSAPKAPSTIQALSGMVGGTPQPTPAPQVMDPLAFSGAPAGFTQGTGGMSGATYYQGSKVIGFDQYGNPQTENGQTVQGAGPALQSWINSPQFNQTSAQGISSSYQPTTAQDFAGGVNEYGQVFKSSDAPPPGLSGDQLNAWMRANPNAVGYSPQVWDQLSKQADANATQNQLAQVVAGGQNLTDAQQAQYNDATSFLNAQAPAWDAITKAAAGSPTANQTQSGYYDYSSGSPVWVNPAAAPAEYLQGGLRTDAQGNAVTGPNAYNALSEYYRESGTTPGALNSVVMNLLNQNPNLMTSLSQDDYTNLSRSLSTMVPGFNIPARASDTSPGGQLPQNIPALTAPQTGGTGGGTGATGGSGTGTSGSGTGGLGPNMSPVDPNNDLRNQQITPGDMLDRFKLAGQQYDTFASSTNPQYEAALRDATRAAAGAGRLGSGMLRTSYGDLANQRTQSLQNERDTLFQNALLGSVDDAQTKFQDLLAEQSYQTGAQQQAFNQAVTSQQLQELLTSGAFSRALQMFNAGQLNDPSQMQLSLANIWANQANAANMSAGNMATALGSSSVPRAASSSYPSSQATYPTISQQAPIGTPTTFIDPITGQIYQGISGY